MIHVVGKRVRRVALLCASFFVLGLGCGPDYPPTVPVSGTVTLDGQPIAGAAVMFVPRSGGRPAYGVTDAAGRFVLQTFHPRDGALVGDHQVTVTLKKVRGVVADEEGLSGELPSGGLREEWLIPPRYADPTTSSLVVPVQRGAGPVRLELSSR